MAELIVMDVPETLRAALTTRARAAGVSVNAVASEILCTHYDVPLDGEPRSFYRPRADRPRMVFRVPDEVRDRVRVEAAHADVTMGSIVKSVLATAVGIPGIEPRSRTNR